MLSDERLNEGLSQIYLDGNRARVAFNIVCVLPFFKNIAVTWKRGSH